MTLPSATLQGIPAAQYLRMSTEHQEYSLDNQAAAIRRYAEEHGFSIVKTYEDAGKSGLTMNQRHGLKDLLAAILKGKASYRAVLVYDVSRWGRFQDTDEAAHYEYLCRHAGIPVYYAAEQFGDLETSSSHIMKVLKRTMAAEFSRELSEKVFAGKKRLAELGFHQAGPAGYGLRRLMISADGRAKQELKKGEAKSRTTDRVILVPGTPRETKWIRWIHAQFVRGRKTSDISKELNLRKVPWLEGKRWNMYGVRQVLTNRKYAGCNAWALTTERLGSKMRHNLPEDWVLKPGAFTAIVDPAIFERTQRIIANRTYHKCNETLLDELRGLWRKRGHLSESMIDRNPSVPSCSTLRNRFGSMAKVYELIGFRPASVYARSTHKAEVTHKLRRGVINKILELFPGETALLRPSGRRREVVRFDGLSDLGIVLCRSARERSGLRYWSLYVRPRESALPTLVCLLSSRNESVERFFLAPNIDAVALLTLTPKDRWFERGIRLEALNDLRRGLHEVLGWVRFGSTHRPVSSEIDQQMSPVSRKWCHHAERVIAKRRRRG